MFTHPFVCVCIFDHYFVYIPLISGKRSHYACIYLSTNASAAAGCVVCHFSLYYLSNFPGFLSFSTKCSTTTKLLARQIWNFSVETKFFRKFDTSHCPKRAVCFYCLPSCWTFVSIQHFNDWRFSSSLLRCALVHLWRMILDGGWIFCFASPAFGAFISYLF